MSTYKLNVLVQSAAVNNCSESLTLLRPHNGGSGVFFTLVRGNGDRQAKTEWSFAGFVELRIERSHWGDKAVMRCCVRMNTACVMILVFVMRGDISETSVRKASLISNMF